MWHGNEGIQMIKSLIYMCSLLIKFSSAIQTIPMYGQETVQLVMLSQKRVPLNDRVLGPSQ